MLSESPGSIDGLEKKFMEAIRATVLDAWRREAVLHTVPIVLLRLINCIAAQPCCCRCL